MHDDYASAINDSLVQRIKSWTSDVFHNPGKLNAYIDATESTANKHKEAVIDDLLGETKPSPGAVLVSNNGTIQWTDGNEWQMAHDRSKY